MLIDKTTQTTQNGLDQLPKILLLNANAEPLDFITYEDSAYYFASDKVLWSMGEYEVVLRGGTNAQTGKQSMLKMDTIIAIKNKVSPFSYMKNSPALSNEALFERDRNICAYCGHTHKRKELTRDHIIPTSKGGMDTWENVVAACKPCNSYKDNMTPEQAGMPLLYVPYTPSYHEHLILQNRNILADQLEFLMKKVPKHSRLWM